MAKKNLPALTGAKRKTRQQEQDGFDPFAPPPILENEENPLGFRPTKAQREAVKLMVACGVPYTSICRRIINPRTAMPIAISTLKAHFTVELCEGADEENFEVAKALRNNAIKKNNVAAQIFWLKGRAGWTYRNQVEGGNDPGNPNPAMQGVMVLPAMPTSEEDWLAHVEQAQ